MNSHCVIAAACTCMLLATTVTVCAEDTVTAAPPDRFGRLLQVGETVLLRPSTTHPVYSIQLLTDDQAEELRSTYVEYTELQKQRDGIEEQLQTAKGISERAALFVEHQSLETAIRKMSSIARLEVYTYRIFHMGEDFVSLKKPGMQKHVPFRSIREMHRSESLVSRTSRTARRSSDRSTRRMVQFVIRYASAAKVAEMMDKFYPDAAREVVVREDANRLLITSDNDSLRQLEAFVNILDVAAPDTNPPTDERQP